MLSSLDRLLAANYLTAIGLGVVIFGLGLTIAGKFDNKFGYIVAAVGLALGVYTLHTMGIF